jgi:hypothetical protein
VSHLIIGGAVRNMHAVRRTKIAPTAQEHFATTVSGGGNQYAIKPTGDLFRFVPFVWDQGPEGSCVDNVATMLLVLRYIAAGLPSWVPSRQFLYWCARVLIDGNSPSDDSGSEGLSGLKALTKYGTCREQFWPYLTGAQGNLAQEPSPQAFDDAEEHQATAWYSLYPNSSGTSTDWMRAALSNGYGCSICIDAFPDRLEESCTSGICDMPKLGERADGGHDLTVLGHDDNYKFPSGVVGGFKCLQSWGQVGQPLYLGSNLRGLIWLPYRYFDEGHAFDPATLHFVELAAA